VTALLKARGVRYVTQEEWRQIDAAEVAAGKERGKPRVKIIEKEAMLAVLAA
jgi:ferredoxin--NADP+ reductase